MRPIRPALTSSELARRNATRRAWLYFLIEPAALVGGILAVFCGVLWIFVFFLSRILPSAVSGR